MSKYNHPGKHRLMPRSGWDPVGHLQWTGPIDPATLAVDNGYGEPQGLPSGSVLSLATDGTMIAGCTGQSMPLFLYWNLDDTDGYPGHTTADGKMLSSITGNSYGGDDIALLWQQAYTEAGATNTITGAIRTWKDGKLSVSAPTGMGNHTTWPGTCAMELSSTEFDVSRPWTDFVPGTLLTSPGPATEDELGKLTSHGEEWYQKRRGGYLRPAAAGENVCGVVSKGIFTNENGFPTLQFWACYIPVPLGAEESSPESGGGQP